MIDTYICANAEKLLSNKVNYMTSVIVDVIKNCSNNWPNKSIGFIVDNSNKPTSWQTFNFLKGEHKAKLISMSAQSTIRYPYSNMKSISPNILKIDFDYGDSWWNSPARIVGIGGSTILFRARNIRADYSVN